MKCCRRANTCASHADYCSRQDEWKQCSEVCPARYVVHFNFSRCRRSPQPMDKSVMESGVLAGRTFGNGTVTKTPEHKSAVNFWRVVRLFFLVSFGALFGMAC